MGLRELYRGPGASVPQPGMRTIAASLWKDARQLLLDACRSQEGSQDGWVALRTLPPCLLGFQDRGVLLILMPIFGHFSCHWLLINAHPPLPPPSATDRCVGPVETRGGQKEDMVTAPLLHPTDLPTPQSVPGWGVQRAVKEELEGLVGFRAAERHLGSSG